MRAGRKPDGRPAGIRGYLWPPANWKRLGKYQLRRLLRLSGSPYAVSMGCAVGVAVSMTPLLGFHFILTFALAWPLRGNLLAGAIGTFAANPLTFPFIWGASYEIGTFMLGHSELDAPAHLEHEVLHKSFAQIRDVLEPMLVGSMPLGLVTGGFTFLILYRLLQARRDARRVRLAGRRLRNDLTPAAPAAERRGDPMTVNFEAQSGDRA